MALFGLTVAFRLKPDQTAAFLRLMCANASTSLRDEPGCLRFDVLRPETGDGHEVFLYEVYTDAAAFDLHLASPHFTAFDAATHGMVMSKKARRYVLEDLS